MCTMGTVVGSPALGVQSTIGVLTFLARPCLCLATLTIDLHGHTGIFPLDPAWDLPRVDLTHAP